MWFYNPKFAAVKPSERSGKNALLSVEVNMEKQAIKVHRHNLPAWDFVWSDEHEGLVHTERKNTYKLFFENPADSFKPIWIGMLVNNGTAWITWEKEIKAKCIEFCGTKVFFD